MIQRVIGETFGGLDHFRLVAVPPPPLGAKEVRVTVRAAALGYADILGAAGKHQTKPPLP